MAELVVERVRKREDDADADGVRGGWKRWDFAPEMRGAEPWSRAEKLNAPGMVACGVEFVIVVLRKSRSWMEISRCGGMNGFVKL
jgi:hypothetical protein